jgi:DNA-binding NtrC family response regulator
LILGPTGAGKELVAQTLHEQSGRSGRMVAFNVCAIADSMLEDALFGHARGAFTGANNETLGYLAEADKGSLFLDEISGLPITSQAKLLRAIETGEFRPVGAQRDRQSNFRVVAATNEDIGLMTRSGSFRSDLAQRLMGVVLFVPALTDRREDILMLTKHFIHEIRSHAQKSAVEVRGCGLRELKSYDWPGNVRELKHVVQRALAFADRPVLGREEVRAALQCSLGSNHPPMLDEPARRRFQEILDHCSGDTARAAAHLGVHRVTVYRRMRRFGISPPTRQG